MPGPFHSHGGRPALGALRRWAAGAGGAAAAEFALVLPLMLLILFAILSLGLALYNYEMLTGGIRVGIRQFAISRGSTTAWSDTNTVIRGATQPALAWTTLGNGTNLAYAVAPPATPTVFTACNTDAACSPLLVTGAVARLTGAYPCTIIVMSINLSAGCTLSQSTQELVQ